MLMNSVSNPLAILGATDASKKIGIPVVAHRGVCGGGVRENSFASLEHAIKYRIAAEIDVFFADSGDVLIHHGPLLVRDLPQEMVSIAKNPSSYFTLEAALDLVKGQIPLLIELKHPSKSKSEVVDKGIELLAQYAEPFLISSFDPSVLAYRQQLPDTPIGLLSFGYERFPIEGFDFALVQKIGLLLRPSWRSQTRGIGVWTFPSLKAAVNAKVGTDIVRIVNVTPEELARHLG